MRTRKPAQSIVAALLGLAALLGPTAQAAEVAVPPVLKSWEGWVLHGAEYRRCPFLFAQDPNQASAYRCAWPGRLQVSVTARAGSFSQRWQVYTDSWIVLPGNLETWPRDVRVNGATAAVVERMNRPWLRLPAGDYQIAGRFEWTARPESLDISAESGLVDLTVEGQRVSQPERPGGSLALGKASRAEAQAAGLEVQVYRLVIDEIPTRLETQIRLQVAGDAREEVLARALPNDFVPVSLAGDLPARLDADGRLRVQVRPGSHTLYLAARGAAVATKLQRPAPVAGGGTWPRAEIWSFAGVDRLRVAAVTGAESVDPSQVEVPGPWRQLPAYRMNADTVLAVEETQRGLSSADGNRLSLRRELWLDFDHGGYTARDNLTGRLRQEWRLDMQAPFRLESARSGGQNLLVTEAGADGRRGVEVRSPQLALETLSRLGKAGGSQPATGWATRFDGVSGQLNLPPGHLLLAAIGPDEASGTWWSNWGLWSLFGVFIVVLMTFRIAGLLPAVLALGGLILTYQEWPSMIWLWANLLVAMALAAVVPEGKLQRFVKSYRLLAVVALAVALLPFAWTQVRYALYPQLSVGSSMLGDFAAAGRGPGPMPAQVEEAVVADAQVPQDAAAAAADGEAMPEGAEAAVMADRVDAPASAPPPPLTEASNIPRGRAAKNAVSSVSPYGLNNSQMVQRYAAGTALQTGPGIPAWRYVQYGYGWSGPVEPTDTVRFVILGPFLLALWRVLGVGLLIFWFIRLLQHAWQFELRLPARFGAGSAAAVFLSVGLMAMGQVRAQDAGAVPGNELLNELGNRLKAQPPCYPHCATLMAARIAINGDRLSVEIEASALANVAVPIPNANDRWQIESVSIDGGAGFTVLREGDGSLWVPLRSGAHRIRLEGRVASVANLQLSFPSVPRSVSVSAAGWEVAGVTEGRMLSSAIEFTRQRAAAGATVDARAASMDRGAEFPAFVRVTRDFSLDLDWSVATVVERIAPERGSIAVEVPLAPGESVLTPGVEVRGNTVLAGIPAGSPATAWQSGLARSEELQLTMPAAAARAEVWRFSVNPQWHAEFEGMPAVLPDDVNAPNWLFTYYPRAGEILKIKLTRPKGAPGGTLAIDSARQWIRYGARSADAGISFQYRSTQGGRHVIDLPPEASVEMVAQDGQPLQIRPEKGKLSIGLLPGQHSVEVNWRTPRGASMRSGTEAVNLNEAASNVSSSIELPQDRWILFAFAGGAGIGPAILYWGELVAFLITAWGLGRWSGSPLKTREWLLLGLGLSTLSWLVFIVMLLWFVAMRWRQGWQGVPSRFSFNAVQAMLAIATVIALSSLIFSGIRYGLFSTPDMGVTGTDPYSGTVNWFRDRVTGQLPAPSVISVPMWTYKALIFAWALWVAFAIVRWLKWAWQCWSTGGYWRSKVTA